jgi:DNA-binding CsgD family transcriptional regulator
MPPNRTRWTPAEHNTIRLYASRKTAAEIAAILDRSTSAVRAQAYLEGITLSKTGHNHPHAIYPKATVQAAVKLREQGLKHREIAQQLGVNQNTVSQWLCGFTRINEALTAP